MTTHNQDDLMQALAIELDSLKAENAERLTNILRGLFACMQDLDARVADLEGQCGNGAED